MTLRPLTLGGTALEEDDVFIRSTDVDGCFRKGFEKKFILLFFLFKFNELFQTRAHLVDLVKMAALDPQERG